MTTVTWRITQRWVWRLALVTLMSPRTNAFLTATKQFPFSIVAPTSTRRLASSVGTGGNSITHIGKGKMEQILQNLEQEGREECQYCVIDVRNPDEIAYTGKLSPDVHTLPLPVIMQSNAFAMEPDDFEDEFGFRKPELDETLVFTCSAGVRSVYACQKAKQAGYSKLVNYSGGSSEWFSR